MKRLSLILIPLLTILLFSGCAEDTPENDQDNGKLAERNVRVAEAVRKDFYSGIATTGRIESDVYVNISPALTGKVEKIHVREGDIVKKGDLLLELDDLNLVQAEETYRNLEKNYQRMEELYRTDAVDQKTYEEIASAYQIARRNYEFALENTRITAPMEGKIVMIAPKEGETYNPMAQPVLLKILSLNRMKAVTYLSDKDFINTRTGMRATVRVDALPDKVFEGRISFISTEADRFTGTFRCEIIIEEKSDVLRHNQFARVFVSTREAKNAVVIPQAAVVNNNTVYTVAAGKAVRRTVETGISSAQEIEILSGIQEGEKVIILGNIGLTDNYPVNVID
jgi:RND family efflux transporter MFP subunit